MLMKCLIFCFCIAISSVSIRAEVKLEKGVEQEKIGWSVIQMMVFNQQPLLSLKKLQSWVQEEVSLNADQKQNLESKVKVLSGKSKKFEQLRAVYLKNNKALSAKYQKAIRAKKKEETKKLTQAMQQLSAQFSGQVKSQLGKEWKPHFNHNDIFILRDYLPELLNEEQLNVWKKAFVKRFAKIALPVEFKLKNGKTIKGKEMIHDWGFGTDGNIWSGKQAKGYYGVLVGNTIVRVGHDEVKQEEGGMNPFKAN